MKNVTNYLYQKNDWADCSERPSARTPLVKTMISGYIFGWNRLIRAALFCLPWSACFGQYHGKAETLSFLLKGSLILVTVSRNKNDRHA